MRDGTLFSAKTGFTRDGHDFAQDTIARGAAGLAVKHFLNLGEDVTVAREVLEGP